MVVTVAPPGGVRSRFRVRAYPAIVYEAEAAAATVADEHDVDALVDCVVAIVGEVPGGQRRRYVIRAVPVLRYEEMPVAEAPSCQVCDAEACADEAHGRRACIETDSLAAPIRPPPTRPAGARNAQRIL